MQTWIIERRKLPFEEAALAVAPALTPELLSTGGGLLFKSCIHKDAYCFRSRPWIIGGERARHYDIRLPGPEAFHLIGTITAGGELSILFRNQQIDDEARILYRACITLLAQLFSQARPGQVWPLDAVTQLLFVEAGLWDPAPPTLSEVGGGPGVAEGLDAPLSPGATHE